MTIYDFVELCCEAEMVKFSVYDERTGERTVFERYTDLLVSEFSNLEIDSYNIFFDFKYKSDNPYLCIEFNICTEDDDDCETED